MNLSYENGLFYASCLLPENDIPRRAGFSWDKNSKRWVTRFVATAAKVCCTPEARALLIEAQGYERRTRELSYAKASDYQPPCPQDKTFLPYQRAGVQFMVERPGVLLADAMGLGKTIQAIGLINTTQPESVLIVCPASLKRNWVKELRAWCTLPKDRHPEIFIVEGRTPVRSPASITVINYDILPWHIETLQAREWDLLILDECQYLKNKKANRTLKVTGGRKTDRKKRTVEFNTPIRAKRKLALTGTPILNRPIELFPILHYLDPHGWPDQFSFALRYCAAKKSPFGWDFKGSSNLEELQEKLRGSIMIRRRKEDVLTDLPPKVRQIIELDLEGGKNILQKEREAMPWAKGTTELSELDYRDVVKRMDEGAHFFFEEASAVRRLSAVAKIPAVIEHLKECLESSGKVVCFAHHKEVVEALVNEFGHCAVAIHGGTPLANRHEYVETFQKDPACKLFIGNIIAAGTGITLTAASHVVFAELSWVPGEVTQAEDRCHRIGQKDSVLVQHLVVAGSIDATMAKAIIYKQGLIDKALDLSPEFLYALQ